MTEWQWVLLQEALLHYQRGLEGEGASPPSFDEEYGPQPTPEDVDELMRTLEEELR